MTFEGVEVGYLLPGVVATVLLVEVVGVLYVVDTVLVVEIVGVGDSIPVDIALFYYLNPWLGRPATGTNI